MPPRIRLSDSLVSSVASLRLSSSSQSSGKRCLRENNVCSQAHNHIHARPLHTTTCLGIKQKKEKYNSPWIVEKREAKEAKNVKRQAQLQQSRETSKLDPILGQATPWTRSLHSQPPPLPSVDAIIAGADESTKSEPEKHIISLIAQQEEPGQLNYNLSEKSFAWALSQSKLLTAPAVETENEAQVAQDTQDTKDTQNTQDTQEAEEAQETQKVRETREAREVRKAREAREVQEHLESHDTAVAAMHRILSLGNGASSDRTYARKQTVIAQFGRHNTDKTLPPIQHILKNGGIAIKEPKQRAGPDTGSSEVQVALYTAKIQHLSRHLKVNIKDKANKKNLREMVHKRQKLLKYLKRKERGGPRYQNIMASIGLDDAAVTDELFI